MSLVKLFGSVDGIMPIKAHFRVAFGFSGFLDLAFLFVEEIQHGLQKGSGYFLILISSQALVVSPSNNDLVDL